MRISRERCTISCVAMATTGIILTYLINVLIEVELPGWKTARSWDLALAITLIAILSAVGWSRSPRGIGALLPGWLATAVVVVAMAATQGFEQLPMALLIVGPLLTWVGLIAAHRLPGSIDGASTRRRVLSAVWLTLGLLTVLQTARLNAFVADPGFDWWLTTRDPLWSRHMCMVAYVQAADMNRQGVENIYLAEHYPGLNPDAAPTLTVRNFTPDDPYQYLPQFLLLPRLALALSDDFRVIYQVWFGLQTLAFLTVALLFARWWGGTRGLLAGLLIPLVFISVPTFSNFQYGQFHIPTLILAVAAFIAFEGRRNALGGLLMATSILSKMFPALLLIPLAFQRRWRALAWTAGFGVVLTILAWFVVGTEPFRAFFFYQLPRLRDGSAFAFWDIWPDYRAAFLAGNISVYSLMLKLSELGVPAISDGLARGMHGLFTLVAVLAAGLASRAASREERALVWLAVLNLAAMTSPAAWGDYVPVGSLLLRCHILLQGITLGQEQISFGLHN